MATMTGVSSEIGRLRTVVVHRPGIEISRITPDNSEALLFDDVLWLERAQEEHDRFTGILRSRGVEVLYLRDLLGETLADDTVRGAVIDRIVSPAVAGERVAARLDAALRECPMEELLDVLMGGVLSFELPHWGIDALFAGLAADRFSMVIRALPNLLFMRDNSAWINDGVVLGVLASPARRPESILLETVYRNHPRFGDLPVWYGDRPDDHYPASIEGGDVLVLDEHTVLVGSGERTSPAAVEALARRLFAAGTVKRVVVAHFRRDRAVMHLDTVFTMVGTDVVNAFPQVLDDMDVYVLEPGGTGLRVTSEDGLVPALRRLLPVDDITVVTTGGTAVTQIREQWDDGNNTVAIEPGVVVAYARNTETNARLRDAGIEVLELDASELCRGRGGSRCMTQPVWRDPVEW